MLIPTDEIKVYLESILGVTVHLKSVELKVPYYIQDAYKTAEMKLQMGRAAGLSMLLLLPVDDVYPDAVTLSKHIAQVRKATDAVIVYVGKSLSKNERRSLRGHLRDRPEAQN